jgi:hypothetical protein
MGKISEICILDFPGLVFYDLFRATCEAATSGDLRLMATKKAPVESGSTSVSLERATRLYRMLSLLGQGAQTRASLVRRLRLGIRGYYRDLEVLRAVGIIVEFSAGKYHLREDLATAIERLPFPDPNLNLGEARLLAKGRSRAHKKIREHLQKIEK